MTYQELKDKIAESMRVGNNNRRDTLRMVLNEVKNIEINERREITTEDVNNMIKRVLKQTKETLDASIKANNNQERTEKLKEAVEILEDTLPEQLDGENLFSLLDSILSQNSYAKKDIGVIMKKIIDETEGNFNKASAAQYLQQKL